jgi:HAD superfamily hydrolase (TIGR01459 family)
MLQWVLRGWRGGGLGIMTLKRISGLRELVDAFDGMIIDQYGILHEGTKLYAGAAQVMAELHRHDKPVVIVTNSGKRAAANVDRIVSMGIPRQHFVDCVSSGEIAFSTLQAQKAFVVGRQGEDYGLDGIEIVDDLTKAEVILFVGSNAPRTSLEDYAQLFKGISLPAICCNPDKWMVSPHGLLPAAGAIAAQYEAQGGSVRWIGKPYANIYEAAQKFMPQATRVLCIGDSAEHDVAGGRNAGLKTLLVQQGVSADLTENDLHPQPDFILKSFVW